jgi:hypothetical protein
MEAFAEASVESPPTSRTLRDVSQDSPREVTLPASEEEPDPEEIRRKIQETRSRLRARLDAPEPTESPGERDG